MTRDQRPRVERSGGTRVADSKRMPTARAGTIETPACSVTNGAVSRASIPSANTLILADRAFTPQLVAWRNRDQRAVPCARYLGYVIL